MKPIMSFVKQAVQLTKQFSNIVVTRTFSKAFGLASFELGYIISNKQNIKSLQKN